MEMTKERYQEIGFKVFLNRFLKETELSHFVNLDENELKKRIGQFAKENDLSREEAVEFVKRFINEIYSMVKRVNDAAQQISFK